MSCDLNPKPQSPNQVDAKNKNVELDDKYNKFMDLATEFKKTYPRLSGSCFEPITLSVWNNFSCRV